MTTPTPDPDPIKLQLPWRVKGLPGARSDIGPTYNGGEWFGGGERTDKHVAVRVWTPLGRAATVELDIGDTSHGCTLTLKPAQAREAARALLAATEAAEAEMQRWRDVLERQRAEIREMADRDLRARAGLDGDGS